MCLQPVIIIGAGRSGTNMLRDAMTALPSFSTWPCDEINYIWRHGNRSFPTDEFNSAMATSPVKAFIRAQFSSRAEANDTSFVVEKTCANSLRVGFVAAVFPQAKFIHIIRDGRDVAVSAAKRWRAPLSLRYALRKARFAPVSDIPFYAVRQATNRVKRWFSRDGRLSFWGPVFTGMEEVASRSPIEVTCALQWERCVTAASRELAKVPSDQVLSITYEKFVAQPREGLLRILAFTRSDAPTPMIQAAVDQIHTQSCGRWQQDLTDDQTREIIKHIGPTLKAYGYEN